MKFSKVLIPVDFSENSFKAFPLADQEARENGAQLILLHVTTDWILPGFPDPVSVNPAVIADFRGILEKQAKEHFESIQKKYFSDVKVQTVHTFSPESIGGEIVQYAKQNKCDGIFMMSHGRGALGALFVGSVVQQVLRTAECPVVVLPPH